MDRFLSPVELSHLEAFRFWLHRTVPDWDISLPEGEIVESGKDFPPFYLYRNGVPAGIVESPLEALQKTGNIQLFQDYTRLITDDHSDPTV